jgi:hypothetical protein
MPACGQISILLCPGVGGGCETLILQAFSLSIISDQG